MLYTMTLYNPVNVKRIVPSKDTVYNSFDDVVQQGRDPKYNNSTPEGFKNNTKRDGMNSITDPSTELNNKDQEVISYGYGIPKKSKKEILASKKK